MQWGSLAGRPRGPTCTDPCAYVGCIDCRIAAGRCICVEARWVDICNHASCLDVCIDVVCSDVCIDVGCCDVCIKVSLNRYPPPIDLSIDFSCQSFFAKSIESLESVCRFVENIVKSLSESIDHFPIYICVYIYIYLHFYISISKLL